MKRIFLILLLLPLFAGGQALFNTLYFKSGNLGIGVMSPTCFLDISGQIRMRTLTPLNSDSILCKSAGGFLYYRLASGIISPVYDSCYWRLNGTTLYPKSYAARNVGIGTSTAAQKLDVNGKLKVRDISSNASDSVLVKTGGGVVYYRMAGTIADDSTLWRLWSAGKIAQKDLTTNVGIGTAVPAKKLDVNGELKIRTVSNNNSDSILVKTGGGVVYYRMKSDLIAQAWDSCYWRLNGTTLYPKTYATRNVGIGTSTAAKKLDVNGELKVRTISNNSSDSILVKTGGGVVYYRLAGTIADDSTLWRLWSAGKVAQKDLTTSVGIGTASPAQKLDVNGKLKVRDITTSVSDSVLVKDGGGVLYYRLAGGIADDSTLWRKWTAGKIAQITLSDAVGIGTADPSGTLQVHSLTGSNPTFKISDADLAQNFTAIDADTRIFGRMSEWGSAGGLLIDGISDYQTTAGMILRAFIGSATPTTPAMQIRAGKWNGVTSYAQLAANESAFWLTNIPGDSNWVRVLGNGSFGIGTGAPAQRLDVNGRVKVRNISTSASDSVLVKDAGGVLYYRMAGGIADDSTLWRLWSAGNIAQKDLATNVGIGTAAPARKFEVVGDAVGRNNAGTIVGGLNYGGASLYGWTSDAGTNALTAYSAGGMYAALITAYEYLPLYVYRTDRDTTNDLEVARFYRNVQTGKSADDNISTHINLQIADSLGLAKNCLRVSTKMTDVTSGQQKSSASFWTMNNDVLNENMTINNNGNVGIGTTAPAHKLEVVGNAKANGFILPITGTVSTFPTPYDGLMYRRSADTIWVYNGAAWKHIKLN